MLSNGVDALTHLQSLGPTLPDVLHRSRQAGVSTWIFASETPDDWLLTHEAARVNGGIAVIGVHPWIAATLTDGEQVPLFKQLEEMPLAGIGEVGLDALHARGPDSSVRWERQRAALIAQLRIAKIKRVPVILHCVRAYPEILRILEREAPLSGMLHAWNGPESALQAVLDLGLYVSIGPVVLQKSAEKLRSSLHRIPPDRLLLETDSPSMAPPGILVGEPRYLPHVAQAVADARREPLEALWKQCAENARRLWPTLPRR